MNRSIRRPALPAARRVIGPALALTTLALLSACGSAQHTTSQLDVQRVVVYQSGVGYIEQSGEVTGDTLTLQVRPDQINDILATLVVIDENGGAPSVSLPLDASDTMPWSGLPTQSAGGMGGLLNNFRGAEVTITHNGNRVAGRIVGTEVRENQTWVTVLTSGDALVPVPVESIDRVDLQNESLAIALERSLDRSLSDSDWKPVDVTLHFPSAGRRQVSLSYVVEMPAWKPVYRAVVRDDGRVLLQGWGIVDNVSGEDWNDITMSLTAGTPISFRYDLYSPIFVPRPDLSGYGVTSTAQLAPPPPIPSRPMPTAMPAPAMEAAMAPGYGMGASAYGDSATRRQEDIAVYGGEYEAMDYEQMGAGFSSTQSTSLQGLFRYDLGQMVTLPDQSSTLVPLLNEVIDGDDVLVWQTGSGSGAHPYRSLELNNDTSFPIQAAPISIYREDTFVGEGITPVIPAGSEAYIAYAIDNRVTVSMTTATTSGEVRLTRIQGGYVHTESAWVHDSVVSVTNALDDDHALLVQVMRLGAYELVDPPEGTETQEGFYMIPVNLTPGEPATLTVRQLQRQPAQLDIFDPRVPGLLGALLTNADAAPATRDQVAAINAQLATLSALTSEQQSLEARRSVIQSRSAELRNNMNALGTSATNAELRATLVERLAEQDELSAQVAGELVRINEEQSELRIALRTMFENLNLTL
jgi:hypothetical protein